MNIFIVFCLHTLEMCVIGHSLNSFVCVCEHEVKGDSTLGDLVEDGQEVI